MNDILIKNGLIVTDSKRYKSDIRVSGEKIIEIGKDLAIHGNEELLIDAENLVILPGGIDPHVHLSLPDHVPKEFRWSDDFESGSKAAIAGGLTTLGCISVPANNETPLGTLERESETIRREAIADIMIHPVLFGLNEEKLAEIPQLAEKGCSTIKIFMVTDDYDANPDDYKKAIQAAKEVNMLTMIHCEDNTIIKETCEKMIAEGRGSLKYYAESRPVKSEVIATQKAVEICRETGASIYVVHLSSEGALRVCEDAQKQSLPVHVEGRPIFLYLTRKEYLKPDGALYVVQPPLREKSDVEYLWKGLQQGSIHTIATDHAPHTREQKLNPDLNISKLVPGINELQVMLPMLHSKAVLKGKISLEKFVALTSTNVAKLFGLYPRKGTIQVGADADIVIWDMQEERVIKDEDMYSQAGFTMYDGEKHIGWPNIVIRRGEIVFKDRKIIAKAGSGQVLIRGSTQPLV